MKILHQLARESGFDLTGNPTRVCLCDSDLILVPVIFDEDNEISSYLTTGFCACCGAMLTVPTKENSDDLL